MPEAECWGKGWRRKDVHLPDETFPFMGQAARCLAACSLSWPWWRAQRGVRAFQCGAEHRCGWRSRRWGGRQDGYFMQGLDWLRGQEGVVRGSLSRVSGRRAFEHGTLRRLSRGSLGGEKNDG